MNWWCQYLEDNREKHVAPNEFAKQLGRMFPG